MDENAKKDRKKIAQKKQYGCSKHDRTDKNYRLRCIGLYRLQVKTNTI